MPMIAKQSFRGGFQGIAIFAEVFPAGEARTQTFSS